MENITKIPRILTRFFCTPFFLGGVGAAGSYLSFFVFFVFLSSFLHAAQLWRPKKHHEHRKEGSRNIATLYLHKWMLLPGGTLIETAHALVTWRHPLPSLFIQPTAAAQSVLHDDKLPTSSFLIRLSLLIKMRKKISWENKSPRNSFSPFLREKGVDKGEHFISTPEQLPSSILQFPNSDESCPWL